MENKQMEADMKNGTSSVENEKRRATTDKPRGRGRPAKFPRREYPKPEQTIPGEKTTEPLAENNGNDDNNVSLSRNGKAALLAFYTANYSVAALNSAHAACAAARAAYGASVSSAHAFNPAHPTPNVGSHAACFASAEAEAASIASAIATSNSRLQFVNSLGFVPGTRPRSQRVAPKHASPSGPAPPHAG